MLLRSQGFDVFVAYDGQQAIEVAHSCHPSVLIVDLAMPILDGFELAKLLRNTGICPRAFSLSLSAATPTSRTLTRPHRAQFDEYVVKPPQMSVLLSILSEVSTHGSP